MCVCVFVMCVFEINAISICTKMCIAVAYICVQERYIRKINFVSETDLLYEC